MVPNPNVLSPEIRNDLNLFTGKFEKVSVSLKKPTCPSLLVNVGQLILCYFIYWGYRYNPNEQNSTEFLDQLAINIDKAIGEKYPKKFCYKPPQIRYVTRLQFRRTNAS